jgi:hypothetical protein
MCYEEILFRIQPCCGSGIQDPVPFWPLVRDVQSGAYFIWWISGSGFQNLFVQGWINLDPGSRIRNIGVSQIKTRYSDPDLKSDWIGNSMPGLKLLIRDLSRGHPEKKSFRSATLVSNAEFRIRDILVRIRIRFRTSDQRIRIWEAQNLRYRIRNSVRTAREEKLIRSWVFPKEMIKSLFGSK